MLTIEQAAKEYAKKQYEHISDMRFQCETHFEAGIEFAQQFYPIERDKDGFTTEKQREDFYNNFPILLNGYYGLELINEMTVDLDTPSYGYTHWRPVNLK